MQKSFFCRKRARTRLRRDSPESRCSHVLLHRLKYTLSAKNHQDGVTIMPLPKRNKYLQIAMRWVYLSTDMQEKATARLRESRLLAPYGSGSRDLALAFILSSVCFSLRRVFRGKWRRSRIISPSRRRMTRGACTSSSARWSRASERRG